jgi:hypothetical protein
MKSAQKIVVCVSVMLLAGLVATGLALEDQGAQGTKKGKETTMTGCLSKGDTAGTYVLTDQKTGKKVEVTGTPDLEKHAANHTVRITGTKSKDQGKAVFNATKLEHVSETCAEMGTKKSSKGAGAADSTK